MYNLATTDDEGEEEEEGEEEGEKEGDENFNLQNPPKRRKSTSTISSTSSLFRQQSITDEFTQRAAQVKQINAVLTSKSDARNPNQFRTFNRRPNVPM